MVELATKSDKKLSLNHVQSITVTAIFTAMVYVFTAFVNIKLPVMANGGLIHLGNIPLLIAAIVFGWRVGMIAGGVGMALFDVTSGWAAWAPFTLMTVGLMGLAVGKISSGRNSYKRNVMAVIVALVIKITGYYIAESVLYGRLALSREMSYR